MAHSDDADDRSALALQQLEAMADRRATTSWTWVLQAGDVPLIASKIGGMPWVSELAPWPRCGVCDKPMGFVLQVDLARLQGGDARAAEEGLLQLFSCENRPSLERLAAIGRGELERVPQVYVDDLARMFEHVPLAEIHRIASAWRDGWPIPERDLELFESHGLSSSSTTFLLDASCHSLVSLSGGPDRLARIVDPVPLDSTPDRPLDAPTLLEPRRMARFERHRDRPALDELPDALALFDALTRGQQEVIEALARRGDKLFGWPRWLQGERWVACPTCGEPTSQLVLMLESGEDCALPDLESASLYVLRCPKHPRALVCVIQDG